MDNLKTGKLIKELRTEKNMTQKQLAESLNITDRAVSKWERGLSLPDISMLEPLSEVLDVSIIELIEGERKSQTEIHRTEEPETKTILSYSKEAIIQKAKNIKKKYISGFSLGIAALLIMFAVVIWVLWEVSSADMKIFDECVSPDGSKTLVVSNICSDDAITSTGEKGIWIGEVYGNGYKNWAYWGDEEDVYKGIWWSPDSEKYVLAIEDEDGVDLILVKDELNSATSLNETISSAVVDMEQLSDDIWQDEFGHIQIKYEFLQWAVDGKSMLINYRYADKSEEMHNGYFWFNCETWEITGIMEIKEYAQ